MGHGVQDRRELRSEYRDLGLRLESSALRLELERTMLGHRAANFRSAIDLTWLNGTIGTAADLQRLHRAAESVGWSSGWSSHTDIAKLARKIRDYQGRCTRERWRRPRLADWQRLVDEAVPILRAAARSQAQVLKRERKELRAARQRHEQMLARRSELRWLLRDELFPDIDSKKAG